MNSTGFKDAVANEFSSVDRGPTEFQIQNHLSLGDTYAICRTEDRSHSIVLDGYNENTKEYTYYDPVTEWRRINR